MRPETARRLKAAAFGLKVGNALVGSESEWGKCDRGGIGSGHGSRAAPNKRSYLRLAAVRALLLGIARSQVCLLYQRSDRWVRLWVELFNRGGIDALASKPRPGRPRKVRFERLQDLLIPVLADPSRAGELHWTGVKLHGWLQEQLAVELGCRTVIRYLHQLDCNLRVPRTWPERQDETAREAFLEGLRPLQDDPDVERWFGDEGGVEGDPRPRRRWVLRGSRPRVPYLGDH
ncbi:MAG TPA: IS630 family transposase, partial [Chthoniobacterales bacterium]